MAVLTVIAVSFLKFFGEQLKRNNQEGFTRRKKEPTQVVCKISSLSPAPQRGNIH